VSGAGGASLMKIDPDTIGFTVGADASGTTVLIGLNGATAGAAPINLLTNQARLSGSRTLSSSKSAAVCFGQPAPR